MTQLIALEVHDTALWDRAKVLPMLDVMKAWGYNALVLHQNDLLDACTQLGLTANYGVSDLRLKKARNAAAWLSELCARLDKFGARLFLEIKEPSYHDYALELFDHLTDANGLVSPAAPGWPAFCQAKVDDLLARVLGLGGLIVGLSSPESRVSLPDHLAGSHSVDSSAWFDAMVEAFRAPLAARGKALYIRDFSYTADLQSEVLAAVARAPGHVGASVKITAHDYFPEYPENPVARQVPGDFILEFEAFGEHTGWGVLPNCRVAEFQRRMVGYREMGAQGMLVRTSWEAINGVNALDSLSAVNVFALPRLIEGDRDPRALVLAWLEEAHGCTSAAAADLMLASWDIPATAYWDGAVFPRHSCLPSSWKEGWISMETNGMGRHDLEVEIDPSDPRLTDTARAALFAAKDASVETAERLARDAARLRPSLPASLAREFKAFDWLPLFARQFALATRATFFAAAGQDGSLPPLKAALEDLAEEISAKLKTGTYPAHHRVLFSPEQIRLFAASLP
ncbi:MAG: hypothetical protein AAF576_09500 [Pseudomonadota bacterium]